MEMDFGRYAGQLRPLTHRDFVVYLEVEAELDADLDRAERRNATPPARPMNPHGSAPPFAP